MHKAALAVTLTVVMASTTGCTFHVSRLQQPLVRGGSSVIHLKQVRQHQRSYWTIKGTRVEVTVLATKYTTVDLLSCRVIATASFKGAARELAWDPTTDDVWIALDAERGKARSLRGRTIDLPDALRAYREDWLDRPPYRVARDSEDGTLWLWRVVSGSVDVIARQVPLLVASASVGARTVAVTRSDAPFGVEAIIIDDPVTGGPLQIARRPLPVIANTASSAHLIGDGGRLAFLGSDQIEVFELSGGTRIRRYPLPHDGAIAWAALHPSLLAYAAFDREGSAGGCSSQVTLIDIDRDVSRSAAVSPCFSWLSWIGPSPFLLLDWRREAALIDRRVFDLAGALTMPATTTGRDWQGLGNLVVFRDGTEGAERAMALTRRGEGAEPLSDQKRVRFISVEPTSRSVVIANEYGEVAVYRADTRRIDRCDRL